MNDTGQPDRTCQLCGASIPAARLMAVPNADTCVACQRQVETLGRTPDPEPGAEGPEDPVQAVEVKENRIVAGSWSSSLMDVVGKGGEMRTLLRSGKRDEARSLVQALPEEAQAALVTFGENPEEALSLTGMDASGKPAYRADVVGFLPSELLATLVAYQTEEKKFNDRLIRAMTPEAFRRTLEETLEPVDNKAQRNAILWEWLEAVAAMDDANHRALLIRSVDASFLMEALTDKVGALDLNRPIGDGVSAFRLYSEDSAVGYLPSSLVDDPKTGEILDAVYESAPDVLRAIVRYAHEQSGAEA